MSYSEREREREREREVSSPATVYSIKPLPLLEFCKVKNTRILREILINTSYGIAHRDLFILNFRFHHRQMLFADGPDYPKLY